MKINPDCRYEPIVIKSLKSGFLNEETNEHIESCANCREAAKVARFFQMNLTYEAKPVKLPAAGLIWWKSKLRQKQRAAEQISKPIIYVQIASGIIFIGAFVWLFNSGTLQSTPIDSAFGVIFNSLKQIIVTLIIGIFTVSLVGLAIIVGFRRFLLEK
jgi:hypothetical protein